MFIAGCWRFEPATGESTGSINDNALTETRSDSDPNKPVAFVLSWFADMIPIGFDCLDDLECNDENDCTDDLCRNDSCTYPQRSGPCSDGNACTENDVCSNGICRGSQKDGCKVCAQSSDCDDDLFCSGFEACGVGFCVEGLDPCPDQLCDEILGRCVECLGVEACDDGDECTENDTCQNGDCVGAAVDCATGDLCVDSWTCDSALGCQIEYVDCDDGDPCTGDTCDSSTGVCQSVSSWPHFDPEETCSNLGCTGSITVPGHDYVPVNNDDDNGNGLADYLESGQVVRENDLVPVDIAFASCMGNCEAEAADHWHLSDLFTQRARLYFDPEKSSAIAGIHPFPSPSRVFLEGAARSLGGCGGPLVGGVGWDLPGLGGYEVCCSTESVPMRVVAVASLDWEPYFVAGIVQNPDLDTCPINGGKRIFTGKIDPLDTFATERRDVWLVATVDPPIGGVTVYFKVWDVDDPFDQLYGVNRAAGVEEIESVTTIDGDTYGNDNNGGAGGLVGTATTGLDGKAWKRFTTSRKPGDNYRAAATCLGNVLTATPDGWPPQVDQDEADDLSVTTDGAGKFVPNGEDSGYKLPVVWSKMLTVWRKLHIETDTMVRPTFVQNTFTMNWSKPRTSSPSSVVLFEVADPLETVLKTPDDQFEGGYVQLQDAAGNIILTERIQQYWTDEDENDEDTDKFDKVRINLTACGNGQIGLACLGGVTSGIAILSDDDLSDQGTFTAKTWGCNDEFSGPVASLAPPDLSKMAERYNLAYIEPVHDQNASAVQGLVAFLQNVDFDVDNGKILWDQALAARNLPVSTATFWTVMVVSAWQADESEDADPDTEDQEGTGVTKGISTHGENVWGYTFKYSSIGTTYTGVCAVFKAASGEVTLVGSEPYTVVHEVGHAFGLDHRAGGAMCVKGDCQREPFQAVELKELRNYVQP